MFSTGLEDSEYLDRDLASQVKKLDDIESAVDLFQEALILTCKKSFKIRRATKKTTSRVNSHEEKNERPKKKISKNYKQRRPKGESQKSVPRRKDKISNSNKKGEN